MNIRVQSGKAGLAKSRTSPILKTIALAVASCFTADVALANPTGASVVNGQVSFNRSGSSLTVTNSPGSIINWQSFSIGTSEITRFVQQSAASAVLNRVIGADPSAILGALQSNGRVFLINPNGILFGAGAQINVAGLVASTLNLSNADFLAGRMRFVETPGAGSIVNQGAITAPGGGQIYLIAPKLENHGIISTSQGSVILAAGRSVELVDAATPNLRVELTAPDNEALNIGHIVAESGKVGIYAGLIKHSGVIRADSVAGGPNGQVLLKATKNATLDAGSVVSANGAQGGRVVVQSGDTTFVSGAVEAKGSSEQGGGIQVLGNHVGVIDSARVDASGASGGGTILVGGDYRGENPAIQNAAATYVGPEASLRADAITQGDGGRVIVWSDEATRVHGDIIARGSGGGKGGFVETSGHYLDVTRTPTIGAGGTWLLDPRNIEVVSTATSNNSGPPTFTPTGDDSKILNSQIDGQLNSGVNVVLDTGSPGSQAGDITVNAAITKGMPNASSLALNATNSVTINAPINLDAGSGGDFNVTTGTTTGIVTVNNTVTAGGAMNFNLAGGLLVRSSPGLNAGLIAKTGQTIVARSVNVVANDGTSATIDNNASGSQLITVNNPGPGADINVLNNNSSAGAARIQHLGTGPQTLTVNNGAVLFVYGNGGNALITSDLGDQTILVQGTGTNRIEVGRATSIGTSLIRGKNQSLTAGTGSQSGAINLFAGVTDTKHALIEGASGTQTISTTGTLNIAGGTSGGSSGAQALLLNNGTGLQSVTANRIDMNGGSSGSGNNAVLQNVAGSVGQQIAVGTSLRLTGGSGGSNNSAIVQQLGATGTQTVTVNGGGTIGLQGGSSSGTTNQAQIRAAGTSQQINFSAGGNIQLTGGTNGTLNVVQIRTSALGSNQTISGVTGISITGGASGGGASTGSNTLGNFASLGAGGNQNVTVGSGGITLTGGGGTFTDNFANIFQADTGSTASQQITVNGGGSITLTGGSSSGASGNGGDPDGSFAIISAAGSAGQTISFGSGGAINLVGGTLGTGNRAGLFVGNGPQTIIGSPTITMMGGGSGGATGDTNGAFISANVGAQNITSGTLVMTAGSGGTENGATIRARTQNITVNGNITLNGTSGTGTGGTRIGGNVDEATDLTLRVLGNVVLNGGAVANVGSAFGQSSTSTTAHPANISVDADGDITLNGGTAAGTRIGYPIALPAGGNISLTSRNGNIALQSNATTGGNIRTTGNVTLQASSAGKSISEGGGPNSTILANTLTATAHSGIVLNSNNQVTSVNLTNTTANGIQFTEAAGILLTVAGVPQVGGNLTLTADDMNITGNIDAGTGTVSLRPTTLARNVNIESATPTANTLSLSPAELNRVTNAGVLEVGRLDGTGNLNVTAGLANTDINAATLKLLGGRDISITGFFGGSGTEFDNNLEARANIHLTVRDATLLFANGKQVTLIADNDANDAGDLAINNLSGSPRTVLVGTSSANTANMTLQGRSVSVGGSSATSAVLRGSGTQAITATGNGILRILGGTGSAFAVAEAPEGAQNISASGIVLSGGDTGSDNGAVLMAGNGQNITVGFQGISVLGGGGPSNNASLIAQTGAAATQTITVNSGGAVSVFGGVGSGSQNSATISNAGTLQTINFTAGGGLDLTGGTTGQGNGAFVDAIAGNQVISGNPTITLTGRASGGGAGVNGNPANISVQFGTQTISAAALSLTGGGGQSNSAFLMSNSGQAQTISVAGTTIIVGGSGIDSAAGIGSRAANVNTTLNSTGTVQLTDGTGAVGADGLGGIALIGALGSFNADVTINGQSSVILNTSNPGRVRIGSTSGGGTVTLKAGLGLAAFLALGAGEVRTSGNVVLQAASGDISQALNGAIKANALTATALTGVSLDGNNQVATLTASNSSTNGIRFNQIAGLPITISGMSQTGGNVTVTADDVNVAGAINASGSTVTLRPVTLAQPVNIELVPTPNTFSVTPTEIGRVTATTLEIGRFDGTGTLTASAPVLNSDVNAQTLKLLSGGNMSITSISNTGSSNGHDLDFRTRTGNMTVGAVTAGRYALLRATSGGIIDANGATNNVTARYLETASANGVELDTAISGASPSYVNATNSTAGNITIRNSTSSATVQNIHNASGIAPVLSGLLTDSESTIIVGGTVIHGEFNPSGGDTPNPPNPRFDFTSQGGGVTLILNSPRANTFTTDPVVYLLDANGTQIARDDDGGQAYVARINRPDLPAGMYKAVAATFGSTPRTMPFDLSITNAITASPPPPPPPTTTTPSTPSNMGNTSEERRDFANREPTIVMSTNTSVAESDRSTQSSENTTNVTAAEEKKEAEKQQKIDACK